MPVKYINRRLTIKPDIILLTLSTANDVQDLKSSTKSFFNPLNAKEKWKVLLFENRYGIHTTIPIALPTRDASDAPATPIESTFMKTISKITFTIFAVTIDFIARLE